MVTDPRLGGSRGLENAMHDYNSDCYDDDLSANLHQRIEALLAPQVGTLSDLLDDTGDLERYDSPFFTESYPP
jgi:hypothetical protein